MSGSHSHKNAEAPWYLREAAATSPDGITLEDFSFDEILEALLDDEDFLRGAHACFAAQVPFEQDPYAQFICGLLTTHGGGMSLADIGRVYDLSRERIRQIENGALRKLSRLLRGPDAHDIIMWLMQRAPGAGGNWNF